MEKELNLCVRVCVCVNRGWGLANDFFYNSLTVVSTKNGKRDGKQLPTESIFITNKQTR